MIGVAASSCRSCVDQVGQLRGQLAIKARGRWIVVAVAAAAAVGVGGGGARRTRGRATERAAAAPPTHRRTGTREPARCTPVTAALLARRVRSFVMECHQPALPSVLPREERGDAEPVRYPATPPRRDSQTRGREATESDAPLRPTTGRELVGVVDSRAGAPRFGCANLSSQRTTQKGARRQGKEKQRQHTPIGKVDIH